MRAALLALPLLLAAAPTGLTIGGERFTQAEIVDARGLPDVGGGTIVMVTLAPEAASRLARLAKASPLPVTLDGVPLSDPLAIDPAETNAIQLKGPATLEAAARLAKRISGKDPLPDSLEE